MLFTFECGVCHSPYRLDEKQITPQGIKVTCPKCMNYFFLKKGTSTAESEPVIEHLVEDGPHQVDVPPPVPGEETVDTILTDADLADVGIDDDEEQEQIQSKDEGDDKSNGEMGDEDSLELPAQKPPSERTEVTGESPIIPADEVVPAPVSESTSEADIYSPEELSSAPVPAKPETKGVQARTYPPVEFESHPTNSELTGKSWVMTFDRFLIPISLIIIAAVALLFLNHQNIISIPGLDKFKLTKSSQKESPNGNPEEDEIKQDETKGQDDGPKQHGFPVIESQGDPWKE